MKMSDGITQAYKRRWSMINTFTMQFILPTALSERIGQFTDDINLNIVSFTSPDFTNDPIEVFVANKWRIHNGKDSLYRFNITFRDQDQMNLYKKFMDIYNFSKINYFKDCALGISVYKDADWGNEQDKLFLDFNGCIVESVSNLSFSNATENQIAEFSVNFKCNEFQVR